MNALAGEVGVVGGEALRLLLLTPDVTYQSNTSRDEDILS